MTSSRNVNLSATAPATPGALSPMECCGVAANFRGLPGAGNLTSPRGGTAVQIQDIQTGITLKLHGFLHTPPRQLRRVSTGFFTRFISRRQWCQQIENIFYFLGVP